MLDMLRAESDFAMLALASALLLIAVCVVLRRTCGRSPSPVLAWGSLTAIFVMGWFMVEQSGRRAAMQLREMVEGAAGTFASELEHLGHAQIDFDTSPEDPTYLAMIHAQLRWLKANPALGDIYTLRKQSDASIALVVDCENSHTLREKADGMVEHRSYIGKSYNRDSFGLNLAFAGHASFDEAPVIDQHGTWVGAYVPMLDEHGRVEAVLGVDFPAATWVNAIGQARLGELATVAVFVIVHVAVLSIITALTADLQRQKRNRAELESAKAKLELEIAERRLAEKKLAHEASHDALTELPNRTEFLRCLQRSIEKAQIESNWHFAVLFLDLDNFKMVNDGLGHAFGDQLLVQVARRLTASLRPSDNVAQLDNVTARLGGDEFVVLLNGLRTPDEAIPIADRIRESLALPFMLEGQSVVVSSSVGVVPGQRSYRSASDLLRDADIAMYDAKNSGKSQHAVFDQSMRDAVNDRLQLENDLRSAIENRQLHLVFQPIVNVQTLEIWSLETLVRWNHPTRGMVSPAHFIAIAEETGLISPLGSWVLEEACRSIHEFNKLRPAGQPLTIAVNVSKWQLRAPGFVDDVRAILQRTATDARFVKFEITESAMVKDVERVIDTIHRIRELGIGFYIDDFGTGYSSLSCLHQFPLEVLKVDRSFIMPDTGNREYAAVVNAVVDLAHNFGMKVVAEGVETADQFAQIMALDSDFVQGFLFSRPLVFDDILKMLRDPQFDLSALRRQAA